jgi:hypothetical protein
MFNGISQDRKIEIICKQVNCVEETKS